MESDSLRTASVYINNLLLSRGLLRNGQTIDFAHPDKSDGGVEATMGRIMSVVNDLVLRRDRDAEQRESLSVTIRTIRSDTLRQTTDFERLQAKNAESQRRLGLAESTERALKTQLKSAEVAAKGLKEEMGRMRILVGQTRAQCANEVRKRERVIEGLKKHVGEGGRPRGSGKAVGVATINVVAGIGAEEGLGMTLGTEERGYDLRMETNEFLTELARGLSEDNENMGALVRRTIETLRSLSGCEKEGQQDGGVIMQLDTGYENVAAEMDEVIEHLRTLLTNPSFVPLEEVEVREDEILRLREGWERMEARWREAVHMMDGWRKRMARSGQTVNLEELKMGLSLSPLKPAGAEELSASLENETYEDEGDTQADIDAMDDSQVPTASSPMVELDEMSDEEIIFEDDVPIEKVEEQQEEEEDDSQNIASSSPGPPPQLSPLREVSNANDRRTAFATIVEEDTWDLAQLNQSSGNIENPAPAKDDVSLLKTANSTPLPRKVSSSDIRLNASSRLPRPASALAQQSPLTMASIAAKLAATEREADAARVRAKLKAAKLSSATATITLKPPTDNEASNCEPMKENIPLANEDGANRKRKAGGRALGGRASRRRSTLSPWELESLILGGAALSPVKGT